MQKLPLMMGILLLIVLPVAPSSLHTPEVQSANAQPAQQRVCSGLWENLEAIALPSVGGGRQLYIMRGGATQICGGPLFARQSVKVCIKRRTPNGRFRRIACSEEVSTSEFFLPVTVTARCYPSRKRRGRTFRQEAVAKVWDVDNSTSKPSDIRKVESPPEKFNC